MARVFASIGVALLLGFAAPAPGVSAAGNEEAGSEGQVTTLVGDLAHVEPGSRTVVVEVPLEDHEVTVGASGIAGTVLNSGGQPIAFEDLKAGSKVRVKVRRVEDGGELLSLEVLRTPTG